MTKETAVTIDSFGIKLEGKLHLPEGSGPFPGVVVCHPHPLYGGNMDNNVVMAITDPLPKQGIGVLRFNFRGIGRSEGDYSEGYGEVEDAAAAVKFLATYPSIDPARVALAGYSFGARIALEVASRGEPLKALAIIACPTTALIIFNIVPLPMPKLLMNGDQDTVAKFDQFIALAYRYPDPKEIHIVKGADHLFDGYEEEVSQQASKFFAQHL